MESLEIGEKEKKSMMNSSDFILFQRMKRKEQEIKDENDRERKFNE